MSTIGSIIQLLGGTGLFLYSMKVMCGSIQKAAGHSLQTALTLMTRNRLTGLFTGFAATAVIQSSTATTVMAVSFVSAGMLTLVQSIGVIMGANIGTTITAWVIAILGFKVDISAFAFPAIALSLPFLFIKKLHKENLGEFLIGFGLLFMSLLYIKESMPALNSDSQTIKHVLDAVSGGGLFSHLAFVVVGLILSVILQSSAATIAITQVMAFHGWIPFDTAVLIVLGTSVGTTATAQLAAIGCSRDAKRAAMVHTMFNVFCVVWVLAIFGLFMRFIGMFFPVSGDPGAYTAMGIALFHTLTAVCNTLILIWFVPQIARFVKWMLPDKNTELDGGEYRLQYHASSWEEAPDAGIMLLWREAQKMSSIVEKMLRQFVALFHTDGQEVYDMTFEFAETEKRINQMRAELLRFIGECSRHNLSDSNREKTARQIYVIEKLESISDACYLLALMEKKQRARLARLPDPTKSAFQRLRRQLFKIDDKPTTHIETAKPYTGLVVEFFTFVTQRLGSGISAEELGSAEKMEQKIDDQRDALKLAARKRIEEKGDIESEILFIDEIQQLEHIGDHTISIARALTYRK